MNAQRVTGHLRTAAIITFAYLLIFACWMQDFPRHITDEQAHLSYALQLRDEGFHPPALDTLVLYDAKARMPTSKPNYLNHPATGYYPLAGMLALWPDVPPALLRAIGAAVGALAFLLYLRIGGALLPQPRGFAVYAFFPSLAWLSGVAGTVNIDAYGMLGGVMLVLGWMRWQQGEHRARMFMALGIVLVSLKLNTLLLGGAIIAALLLHTHRRWVLVRMLIPVALLTSLPYLWLWWHYGSPAPLTAGQALLLTELAASEATAHVERWGFARYSWEALMAFPRYHIGSAVFLAIYGPLFGLLLVAMPLALWSDRSHYRQVGVATVTAFLAVFAVHLFYSYDRYLQFGWFGDFYPRYYITLLPGLGYLLGHMLQKPSLSRGS